MPRSLARRLFSVALSVALILALVASSRRSEAAPPKVGDATARELAAQSRPTAKAAPPAQPRAKATAAPHRRAAPAARPHASTKAKAHATAKAKPRSDHKVKAKSGVKHAPVRPSVAPRKPATKAPLARA